MSKNEASSLIKELRTLLENDWKGRYRKYPDQALFALADERVTKAIEKRFEKNGTIKEIKSLDYDFYAGFNRICFEFMPTTGSTGLPSPDAILVIMDSSCKIVGIHDPFDPVQPNRFIPPLPPKVGEQPFVLSRRSKAEDLTFNDEEMTAVQVRGREFFERLASGSDREFFERPASGSDRGEAGVWVNLATGCPYTTHFSCHYKTDHLVDDSKGEIFIPIT